MNREAVHIQAYDALNKVIPGLSDILLKKTERGDLVVRFHLDAATIAFRLRRDNSLWLLKEWTKDSKPQPHGNLTNPHFQYLIADVLGAHIDEVPTKPTTRPKVSVREMRCPTDKRRLFGKIVVLENSLATPQNLIEFSCSVCKRSTGRITMHIYRTDGRFVKTEHHEQWTRREPAPWHREATTA